MMKVFGTSQPSGQERVSASPEVWDRFPARRADFRIPLPPLSLHSEPPRLDARPCRLVLQAAFGELQVNEDWLETLVRKTYETGLPILTVAGGQIGNLVGSGSLRWDGQGGIRVQAVTDGGAKLTSTLLAGFGTPGKLIDHSSYITFTGRTQCGWEIGTDPVPRDGHRTHTDLPEVVWDLRVPGLTLRRASTSPMGRVLRILMGPLPPGWVRITETEVRNEEFSHRSRRADWMATDSRLGRVSARRMSDDWFEVRVVPREEAPMPEASIACTAIARAFGFVLGRRCLLRGYEEVNGTSESRRLDARKLETTANTLRQPLGWQLEFLVNVERLLGLAIDFFLTDLGQRIAPYLDLCWDTADNAHQTQLAISCVCAEGLLRVAAETLGPAQPSVLATDVTAFKGWLKSKPPGITDQFLNRLGGLAGMFGNLGPKDIFKDWIARGVLGVTKDDMEAWSATRNPVAHGCVDAADSREELQGRVDRHALIQNLLNKVFLQLMGYSGTYIDYARAGWLPASFPSFAVGSSENSVEGIAPAEGNA